MSRSTLKSVVQTQSTAASVNTLTNSGALAAVALAELGIGIVVWERETALNTNAERKAQAKHFLELVKDTAPGLQQSERDASIDVYSEGLRQAGKDNNTLAVMRSNYKLLINNASMIDTAESIKKNLKRIRDALSPMGEEERAAEEVKQAGEKYAAALEAFEQAYERLESLKRARYVRECAKAGDINQLPGKAA
jgi:tetratricopeptide (TPR) repeat protein